MGIVIKLIYPCVAVPITYDGVKGRNHFPFTIEVLNLDGSSAVLPLPETPHKSVPYLFHLLHLSVTPHPKNRNIMHDNVSAEGMTI